MTDEGEKKLPFRISFIDAGGKVMLELANSSERTLRRVEVLTIFLKDEETPGGGPSRAHIKFEPIKSLQPKEKAILAHRTWIDGKPVNSEQDQLERLKEETDKERPYVLDISWENAEGKTLFQRIPVGH